MDTNGSNTNRQLRRGSFADGQAHPELYLEARHVGTFADGQASLELYPEGRHVGAFAEGQARPGNYAGEGHEGTFAERTATMGQTPSIDYRCARCGAPPHLPARAARGAAHRGRGASDTAPDPVDRSQMLSVRRQSNLQARA